VPKRISASGRAVRSNERANHLRNVGDAFGALALYRDAISWRPKWSTPWYNIGLVHKYAGQWRQSLEANLEATRLDPSSEAAIWNTGIAATALGDWDCARTAWKQYGIKIPEGEGPIDYPIGMTPIRVALDGEPEVIWTHRIDPARAFIESVPLPTSGRRYGDLLLHDGAPNGYRKLGEREVAVLDELQVLQASAYSTFEVFVEGATDDDLLGLQGYCDSEKIMAENWTYTLRTLCKACSEGRPWADGGHNHDRLPEPESQWRLGLAARNLDQATRILDLWLRATPGVKLLKLNCVLDAKASAMTTGADR
jgi:tetratricopeptide (TPR) repeat protein